jgi:hypothetical protein
VACVYYPSYLGSISSRIAVQADPSKNARPCLKNNQSKKGWRQAQLVESLPSKLKYRERESSSKQPILCFTELEKE